MASADEERTRQTEMVAEKYVDNGAYCLKHKINVGEILKYRRKSSPMR